MTFFSDLRRLLHLMAVDLFGPLANLHFRTLKADLAIRKAVDEARIQFDAHGVRFFVVPTPEGKLRVISSDQARQMITEGYFPKRWKISNIYNVAFFWTDASRQPKYGHSLESFGNMNRYYDWWRSTH